MRRCGISRRGTVSLRVRLSNSVIASLSSNENVRCTRSQVNSVTFCVWFQVVLSVSQKFHKFGCFNFIVVTLSRFIFILVLSGDHSFRGKCRRRRHSHSAVFIAPSWCAHQYSSFVRRPVLYKPRFLCSRLSCRLFWDGHLPTAIAIDDVFVRIVLVGCCRTFNSVDDYVLVVARTQQVGDFYFYFTAACGRVRLNPPRSHIMIIGRLFICVMYY